MRHFNKLLNFFSSVYNNNSKFHHSTLGYLKIFFERNNKLKSTFSTLGNVFRNSKWSDLKVQNIKNSFIKSWSNYFVVVLLVTIMTFSLFSIYKGNALTLYVPLLGDFYEILSFSWTHVEDLLKASLLISLSLISHLKSTLFRGSYVKQDYLFNHSNVSTPSLNSTKNVPNHNFNLADTELNTYTSTEIMYNLARASKSVATDSSFSDTSSLAPTNYLVTSFNKDLCILESGCNNRLSRIYTLSDLEHNYTLTPQVTSFIQQFSTDSTQLNRIGGYNTALALTNLNTTGGLVGAKQDRWLLRNSLLSENLVLNSNAFTQSKKLIGVNFLNSELASKNVWNSTKLHSLPSATTNSFIANLQDLFNNQSIVAKQTQSLNSLDPNLNNFEFFENSRMWLVKKYFFTNQLKHNPLNLTITLNTYNTNQVSTHSSQKLNLFLNLYNQNLENQLSFLTLVSSVVNSTSNYKHLKYTYDLHNSNNDFDILRSNNLVFINKLTHSTSDENFRYYTSLVQSGLSNLDIDNLTYRQ